MEKVFEINNLHCAHCGAKIEEALNKLEGIESAVLNFPMKRFHIHGEFTDELLEQMNRTARSIEPEVEIVPHEHEHHHHEHEHHHEHGEHCECEHEHEHEHHHEHGEHCECEHEHEHEHHHEHGEHCECEHEHEHEHHHEHAEVTADHREYEITGLDCAHCGGKIEEALNKLEGIESAILNFPMKRFRIKGDVTDDLLERINAVAGEIEPGVKIAPVNSTQEHTHEHEHSSEGEDLKQEIIPLVIGILLFAAAVISGRALDIKPLSIALYAAAYLVLGYNILIRTVKNIKVKNFFDENTLMTVATLGAFAIGEYSEAVGVVLFFKIGELFEDFAVARSRKAITDVAALRVEDADVLRNGEYVRIPSEEIRVGDLLRIKAGERIAVDGSVESGSSRVDTSAVNGEPVPLTVRAGDTVMSGCINLSDTFVLRAEAAAEDSMISRLARAVEDASASKPKIDRFITRFAKIYTPVVIATAVLTAVIPSIITGEWSKWIHSALTFLVISCPCALVLSVPLAYFSGIGAASKLGILFKGGDAVEALGKVKAIAFDKTGTLTNGSFTVTAVNTVGRLNENDLLKLCGSCEQSSTHPVAESIVQRCKEASIELHEPEKVTELPGRGISAVLRGRTILCGNERLMAENGIELRGADIPEQGSVVCVAVDGSYTGCIVVSDTIKPSSARSVKELKGMGVKTIMLTGDKTENAKAVAAEIGINSVRGGLLPDGKLSQIGKLREKYGPVMFVGDGINDGPVLAGADVGGAMQSGSDLALEAADAVFISSEPEAVVKAKKISDKALRISYENIVFALLIKAAVMVLGLLGHPNMWLAVFADSGVAMLLVLNSIRILNTKAYRFRYADETDRK